MLENYYRLDVNENVMIDGTYPLSVLKENSYY
jgi:hypothetical protein